MSPDMDEKPERRLSSHSDSVSFTNPTVTEQDKLEESSSSSQPVPAEAELAAISEPLGRPLPPTFTSPVPEGGLDAWLQVFGSWVLLVHTWGLINTFGVYQTFYEKELLSSHTASDISWIGSLQGALLMLVGPIAGPLYDAGYFREILWVGVFLIILGQFMTSLCTNYLQVLLAQGVCIGIGCGLVFLPSTAVLSQYFLKRRALVIGIASTGSPIAGTVFPIIFGRLQPKIGFGWATRIIAFILLGIAIIPLVFMHTRVPPTGRKRSLIDSTALRDVPFLITVAGSFFAFLTLYVAFYYTQLFSLDYGLATPEFAPYLVTFLSVGSIVGRLVPNYLADKLGSLNVWIVVSFVGGILLFVWLGIHTLGGLIAFALLYGLFSGGLVSVTPSAIVTLTPDLSRVGTRMGMLFFVSGVAILVGTPIAGAILGDASERRWQAMIGYAGTGQIIGVALFVVSRIAFYRERGHWKA